MSVGAGFPRPFPCPIRGRGNLAPTIGCPFRQRLRPMEREHPAAPRLRIEAVGEEGLDAGALEKKRQRPLPSAQRRWEPGAIPGGLRLDATEGYTDRLGFHRADGSSIHKQQVVSETRVQRKLAHRHPARCAQVGRARSCTAQPAAVSSSSMLARACCSGVGIERPIDEIGYGVSIAHASRRIQTPNSQHIRVCGIMQKRHASSDLRHAASFLLHGSPGIRTRDQPVMQSQPAALTAELGTHNQERVMGFGPTTFCLEGRRSTPELHPHLSGREI